MKLFKRLTAVLCAVIMVNTTVKAENFENLSDLGLSAKSAVLMEQSTGSILYNVNGDEKLPPASITKIMTLLLVYEAVRDGKINTEDSVRVSAHAASMGGSQVFLEEGETQSVADMIKCIAIASANDAAVAMAEYIGGSEEGFVKLMNERAKELGMENTVFKNACGLDEDGHITTAEDIAKMSAELMKNFPQIREYTTKWQDSIVHKTRRGEKEFGLTNTNRLVKWYDGATGLKTGSTGKAKYCVSATAERNGMSLIAVIMAADNPKGRFREAGKLLDYGFANYEVLIGAKKGDFAGEAEVIMGESEKVTLELADDVKALVNKGGEEPVLTFEVTEEIAAPVEKGMKVGEAVYTADGKIVAEADIVTAENVERAGFFTVLKRLMKFWNENGLN